MRVAFIVTASKFWYQWIERLQVGSVLRQLEVTTACIKHEESVAASSHVTEESRCNKIWFCVKRQMLEIQWCVCVSACPRAILVLGKMEAERSGVWVLWDVILRTQQNKCKTGVTNEKAAFEVTWFFFPLLYPLALPTVSPPPVFPLPRTLVITATSSWDLKWEIGHTSWPCLVVAFKVIVRGATAYTWKVKVYDTVSQESLGWPREATMQYLRNSGLFFRVFSLLNKRI